VVFFGGIGAVRAAGEGVHTAANLLLAEMEPAARALDRSAVLNIAMMLRMLLMWTAAPSADGGYRVSGEGGDENGESVELAKSSHHRGRTPFRTGIDRLVSF
jgi:hypothetical protein